MPLIDTDINPGQHNNISPQGDKTWMFRKTSGWNVRNVLSRENKYVAATYPTTAVQLEWRTPTRFPLCPESFGDTPLEEYFIRLVAGAVFVTNETCTSVLRKFAMSEDGTKIVVWCETDSEIKRYAVASIYLGDGKFIHKSVGTAFEEIGADWLHTEERGLPYDGPKGIDYCCG